MIEKYVRLSVTHTILRTLENPENNTTVETNCMLVCDTYNFAYVGEPGKQDHRGNKLSPTIMALQDTSINVGVVPFTQQSEGC
jgi:hypothetical protein